jgi:hypothetical protein
MKLLVNMAMLSLVVTINGNAQSNSGYQPIPPAPGKYEKLLGSIVSTADNLDPLVQGAKLIVDGKVAKVLSSNRLDSNYPMSLETFTSISVNTVLRGELPQTQNIIGLVEPGGNSEGYEIVYKEAPLARMGEHYILFLKPYAPKGFVNNYGMPLYAPVGFWAGKAKVTDKGVIQFLPAASSTLHTFDGMDSAKFITTIFERIKIWFPSRPPFEFRTWPEPPSAGMPMPPLGPPKQQNDSQ